MIRVVIGTVVLLGLVGVSAWSETVSNTIGWVLAVAGVAFLVYGWFAESARQRAQVRARVRVAQKAMVRAEEDAAKEAAEKAEQDAVGGDG